ncbi:hypothetical protein FB45DRAFT_1007171 [Roridomyces roridus]|uniref:Uncharacterized protein n=1 Tax=Roridomyces roridus TaxID=1738132 RepID=A0AAD7FHX5_9AGAR|nr:hypothetical protein FB45DRAFT_1007171 [Roridomyces roridus]
MTSARLAWSPALLASPFPLATFCPAFHQWQAPTTGTSMPRSFRAEVSCLGGYGEKDLQKSVIMTEANIARVVSDFLWMPGRCTEIGPFLVFNVYTLKAHGGSADVWAGGIDNLTDVAVRVKILGRDYMERRDNLDRFQLLRIGTWLLAFICMDHQFWPQACLRRALQQILTGAFASDWEIIFTSFGPVRRRLQHSRPRPQQPAAAASPTGADTRVADSVAHADDHWLRRCRHKAGFPAFSELVWREMCPLQSIVLGVGLRPINDGASGRGIIAALKLEFSLTTRGQPVDFGLTREYGKTKVDEENQLIARRTRRLDDPPRHRRCRTSMCLVRGRHGRICAAEPGDDSMAQHRLTYLPRQTYSFKDLDYWKTITEERVLKRGVQDTSTANLIQREERAAYWYAKL